MNERDRDEELAQSIAYATATRATSTPPPTLSTGEPPVSVAARTAAVSHDEQWRVAVTVFVLAAVSAAVLVFINRPASRKPA